jgi:transcriptional regulator with XRE-family HTH domain
MTEDQYIKNGERLKIIRLEIGMSQESFSQFLGITQGHLSAMERGAKNISHRIIALLAERIPALDINYLVTGEGHIWKAKETPNFRHLSDKNRHLTEFTRQLQADNEPQEVEQFEDAGATYDTATNTIVPIEIQEDYAAGWDEEETAKNTVLTRLPGMRGKIRTFQISGESMFPALHHGDWVACRPATVATIQDGNMYTVITKELNVSVKYVYRYIGGLLLVPANRKEYKPITIEESEVIEIWEAALRLTSHLTQLPQLGAWQEQDRKIAQLEQFIKNLFPDYGQIEGDL